MLKGRQVGSSLSADGEQPELQPLLYQNAPSVVVNSQTTDGFAVGLSARRKLSRNGVRGCLGWGSNRRNHTSPKSTSGPE